MTPASIDKAIAAITLADEAQAQRRRLDKPAGQFKKLARLTFLQFEFELADRKFFAIVLDLAAVDGNLDPRRSCLHQEGRTIDRHRVERRQRLGATSLAQERCRRCGRDILGTWLIA